MMGWRYNGTWRDTCMLSAVDSVDGDTQGNPRWVWTKKKVKNDRNRSSYISSVAAQQQHSLKSLVSCSLLWVPSWTPSAPALHPSATRHHNNVSVLPLGTRLIIHLIMRSMMKTWLWGVYWRHHYEVYTEDAIMRSMMKTSLWGVYWRHHYEVYTEDAIMRSMMKTWLWGVYWRLHYEMYDEDAIMKCILKEDLVLFQLLLFPLFHLAVKIGLVPCLLRW